MYVHHNCCSGTFITVNKNLSGLQISAYRIQRIFIPSRTPLMQNRMLSKWVPKCPIHCTCSGWLALDSGITIQMILRLFRAALVVKEHGRMVAWPRATWMLLWDTVTSNACTQTAGERKRSLASWYIITKRIKRRSVNMQDERTERKESRHIMSPSYWA